MCLDIKLFFYLKRKWIERLIAPVPFSVMCTLFAVPACMYILIVCYVNWADLNANLSIVNASREWPFRNAVTVMHGLFSMLVFR